MEDEVFELVGRTEQERGGLPVPGDQLTHGGDLRLAELSGRPASSRAAAAPPGQAVGAGTVGVSDGRGQGLHAEVCGA